MRRHILGLIALASLFVAAPFCFYSPWEAYQPVGAAVLRFGIILAVFWLAWPDLHRLPRWAWYVLPLAILALIFARSILVFLLPTLLVVAAGYVLYRRLWR